MYKIRVIAFSLILALFIPIVAVPVQVKAESSATDFSRLVGTAAPVLTAITTCTLGLLFDKAYKTLKQTEEKMNSINSAVVALSGGAVGGLSDSAQAAVRAKRKAMCLVPIERAAAQVILNTITTETINWINGGMNGNPMYSQNLEQDLSKIQDNALVKLAADLQDPNAYPFGKDVLKSFVSRYHSTYQNNSISDLNATINANFPGMSIKDFGNNLLLGGWSSFDKGFSPRNNAIGFNFTTQDHVIAQFQGTAYSKAQALKDELNWGHGFLSQKKCLDPNYPNNGAATTTVDGKVVPNVCPAGKSQILTPGDVVSNKLDKALGNQENALNLGQDLDASITSIFNAMMVKLLQNGLSSLSDSKGGGEDLTKTQDDTTTKQTVEGNATPGSLCGVASAGDWWTRYPKFDITKDILGQTSSTTGEHSVGLIEREKQLQYILQDQNNVIKWIKKSIYILDMCIPGPNSVGDSTIKSKIYGEIMQKYNLPSSSVDQVNEIYNAQFLSDNFGIRYFPDDRLKSPSAVQKIIKTLIDRYYDAMTNGEYGNLGLIDSYPKVKQFYGKLGFYDQQFADNEAKIGLIQGTIAQLTTISSSLKRAADKLDEDKNQNAYNLKYKKILEQFDALVPDLDVSPILPKK